VWPEIVKSHIISPNKLLPSEIIFKEKFTIVHEFHGRLSSFSSRIWRLKRHFPFREFPTSSSNYWKLRFVIELETMSDFP